MRKLLKESDKLEVNLVDLAELAGKCLANSLEALFLYLEEGESHKVKVLTDTVHEYESKVDELRREIITSILDGRLMPHTRSDMLNLIESIDDIADFSEDVIDEIVFLQLKFEYFDIAKGREMQKLILEQFEKLTEGLKLLFIEMGQALVYAEQLEEIESKLDDIEEEMIRGIGQNPDLDAAEKLSYSSLIKNISDLADIIENVGDVIEVIVSVRYG